MTASSVDIMNSGRIRNDGNNLFENVKKEVEENKQKIYERLGV